MKRERFLLFIIYIFFFSFFSTTISNAESDTKKILVLHSYHQGYKWTDDIAKGINTIFSTTNPEYSLFTEFLDTKRKLSEEYLLSFSRYVQQKYKNQKFDVIIVSDNNALDFILQNRDFFSHDIPIVFCGINDFNISDLKGHKNITGVNEFTNPKETLKIIAKVQPNVNNVYVITDQSRSGNLVKANIKSSIATTDLKFKLIYLNELSLIEIIEFLDNLGTNDALLYTFFNRDIDGNVFENYHSFAEIKKASKVPIYGLWDFNLGQGILGGLLASGYFQGKTAAEIASRILNGESADEIAVIEKSPNAYIFDQLEIDRFGIDTSLLPKNSTIINERKTIYDENPEFVITVVIAFIILSIVIIILTINITKRKIAEEAKKVSETKFKAIFDQTFVFVGLLDLAGKIQEVNKTALKFIDKDYKDVIGKFFWKTDWFNYGDSEDKIKEAVISAANGNYERIDVETKSFADDNHYFEVYIKPVYDEKKKISMLLAEGRDITARKKDEEERKKLTNEIIQKNKELEQIVYLTSHDLRTPLVNIQGFGRELLSSYREISELIEDPEISNENKISDLNQLIEKDVAESLNFIENNIRRMDKLFSGILLYSRVDHERPNIQKVKINEILKKIIQDYDDIFKEHNIGVYLAELPDAFADELQIQHVFKYLIDNAVKYLDKSRVGQIKITSEIRHSDVIYCIEDNGIGIEESQKEKIFNMFYRLNPDLTQGEGIGLAMVSKILAKNNGEIWVESVKNVGSKFFVKLSI